MFIYVRLKVAYLLKLIADMQLLSLHFTEKHSICNRLLAFADISATDFLIKSAATTTSTMLYVKIF